MLQFHEFFQLIVCVADEYDEMLLARKLGNLVSPLDIYKPCVDKHSRQSSPMTSKTSREDDPSLSFPHGPAHFFVIIGTYPGRAVNKEV